MLNRGRTMLNWLEHKVGHLIPPHIPLIIIVLQTLTYMMCFENPQDLNIFKLVPNLVLQGEIWRLFTYVFIPFFDIDSPISNLFGWLIFYNFSRTVEDHWGSFRFFAFLFMGFFFNTAFTFLVPHAVATHYGIYLTLFLAFAILLPEYELLLFLVLPVKIKIIAYIKCAVIGILFLVNPLDFKLAVIAGALTLFLFFRKELITQIKYKQRTNDLKRQQYKTSITPRHVCAICDKNDIAHSDVEFRYCSHCGGLCYCDEHIQTHIHKSES